MVFRSSRVAEGTGIERSRNRRNKTVTAPRNCFYETGIFGRVAQDFPQPHYRIVQPVVEIDESVALPETVAQFVSRDDLARVFQEHDKNLKRLFREL